MFNSQTIRNSLPSSLQSRAELISFLALAGSVSLVLVSIAASQALLAVSIIGFVRVLKKNKGAVPPGVRALVPLIVFMIWTLITVLASNNVPLGLQGAKKFFLFLLLPIVPLLMRGRGRIHWIYKAIFFVAVVSSLKGLAQFAANPDRDLLHRITGFMSQWMTYSGLLMLVLVLLTAYAFCNGVRRHIWVFPVGALIILALVLSLTRNSWMGAIAGIVVLVLLRRPRAFIFLLAAILILYSLSPGQVKERIRSIVDTSDPRMHVYMTALHMIQENPWLGVGPKNVSVEALKYRDAEHFPDWLKRAMNLISTPSQYREEEKEYPGWLYQHMHNNFLQIAAETGIPGLSIWLWFMCKLAWDAWGCYRYAKSVQFDGDDSLRKEALTASTAALAAWAALLVAGMFEYNFGDSEVLTLFLFIMSVPYAFAASETDLQEAGSNGNGTAGTAKL
jgi:putative inorganic carbon (hco3(-)) transporter